MSLKVSQARCITMGNLSDGRTAGQERIFIWRSETLIALTALHEYDTRLERDSRMICNHLGGLLSPWLLDAGPFAKVEGRFRREILDPAIKLHQDLKSSSHQYEVRHVPVLDQLTPKQMLDQWELKDADLWQKPRGEKEVGKALYCLHPSIVRLRTGSMTPIVIAKPVIVVTRPERENTSNADSDKSSSLSAATKSAAAIESSPATYQKTFSINPENTAHIDFAENPPVSTDSDSTTTFRSRRRSIKASTYPTTQRQEDLPSSRRQFQHSLESSDGGYDPLSEPRSSLEEETHYIQPYTRGHPIQGRSNTFPSHDDGPRYLRTHYQEERPTSDRLREDQYARSYIRGHRIEGSSNTIPPHAAARQASRRGSRDKSRDRSSPRRSANENQQPPSAPSTPVPSKTSFSQRFMPWSHT